MRWIHRDSRATGRSGRGASPAVLGALACLLATLPAAAFQQGASESPAQRNFDARVELNRSFRQPPAEAQLAAVARLREEIPELAATFDEGTGATRSLYNRVGYLTGPHAGAEPAELRIAPMCHSLTSSGDTQPRSACVICPIF